MLYIIKYRDGRQYSGLEAYEIIMSLCSISDAAVYTEIERAGQRNKVIAVEAIKKALSERHGVTYCNARCIFNCPPTLLCVDLE